MIQLMRLSGETFALHVFKIEQIQSYPDTTITLMNGKKIVVKNDEEDVIKRINLFYKSIGIHGDDLEIGGRLNE